MPETEQNPPAPPAPAPTPAPAARPPAAAVVVDGKTEREVLLEAQLATERSGHDLTREQKKQREVKIAELEDELHRLRQPPRPQPTSKTDEWKEFFGED